MVFFGTGNRVQPGRLVVLLIIFLLPAIIFSQEDSEAVEEAEPRITIEISPDKIIVGQRFDLTIFADFSAYRDVTIKAPQLPEGITLASGPYKSAQTIRIGDIGNPQYIKKNTSFLQV